MKRIGRRAKILLVVAVYFLACLCVFLGRYAAGAERWVAHPANQDVYQNGLPTGSGSVVTADGETLLTLDENGTTYTGEDALLRKATLHAVGDVGDNIATGVLKTEKSKLIGYDIVNGVYSPLSAGDTVTLTIRADVSRAAYQALGSYNGTVGVYNYQTGEILCMVSKPSYDPLDPPDLTGDAYEGVYINRLFHGLYTPGSVFKLITAAAAIDTLEDLDSRTYTCNGGIEIGGEWIACTGNHGTVSFEEALAKSCNAAFAEIANEVGKDALLEHAQDAGVQQRFTVSGVRTSKGNFGLSKADETGLAWAGIGQYTDMVNPMQYLIYMGAIANGGVAVTPYYVDDTFTSLLSRLHLSQQESRMLSAETAERLKQLMRNNVVSEYGDSRFEGLSICGKTGTAEVDDGASHAWFVGFSEDPQTPLAFVVVVEHGGRGSSTAIPVAQETLRAAVAALSEGS